MPLFRRPDAESLRKAERNPIPAEAFTVQEVRDLKRLLVTFKALESRVGKLEATITRIGKSASDEVVAIKKSVQSTNAQMGLLRQKVGL